MATFTDDFERADGGLGNNWIVDTGTAVIASGKVNASGGSRIRNQTINASGRQEAICDIVVSVVTDILCGPLIKCSADSSNGYGLYGTGTLASPVWHLRRMTSGSFVTDLAIGGPAISAGTHTMRYLYDSGIRTFWWDGALIGSVADSTYGANTGAGWYSNEALTVLDEFTLLGDEATALSVSPSPIGNFGGSTELTFTGVTTAWTTGTPGSPTFTVDHGTLSDQEVVSATSATATYTPGTFLGIATFADPSTGATVQVQVTSDPSIAPPPSGPGGLSQAALNWLNAQAEHGGLVLADNDTTDADVSGIELKSALGYMLLGTRTGTTPSAGSLALADAMVHLWRIVNGGVDSIVGPYPEVSSSSVKEDTDRLLARFDTGNPPTLYSIADVLELLGGVPLANHQDILTAISAIPTGDNQEVLDAILAAQGDPLATIKACIDLVYALGTTSNYDLDDVRTWAEAIRGTGLPTVKNVMDKLGPGGTSLETQINALSDLIVTETTIQGMLDILLAAIQGGAGATIHGVLDAIDLLPDQVAAAIQPATPAWPGLANVTLGDSVALSDGLVVTGPMHGLLFTITGYPPGAGKYVFGDVDSWQHTGGVIFCTDNGYYERAESFGLETQILVPRTMEQADSAIVRLNGGWSGTVRPWSRTV